MKSLFFGIVILLGTVGLLLIFAAWVLHPPPPMPVGVNGGELRSVVLITPEESRSESVDVIVKNGLISRITPAQNPQISGYVIPGLANAHMHGPVFGLAGEQALFAFLHLYHGVTHARMAAGDQSMAAALERGQYAGPLLSSCGPFVDGNPPQWRNSLIAIDERSARAAVDTIYQQGYDCVKVYNNLTPVVAANVHAVAREKNLPVIGHVPWRMDFTNAHIDDVQHTLGWAVNDDADGEIQQVRRLLRLQSISSSRVSALAEHALAHNIALTPTLVTLQRKFALGDYDKLRDSPAAMLLPHYYRLHWYHNREGMVSSRLLSDSDRRQFKALFPNVLRAVQQLHQSGVTLHSGSDSPAEFIVPGAGLIEELHLLNSTGLSAEQVLRISSVNSARAISGSEYGALHVGAPAEMVIYGRDPTVDLANLSSLKLVVRGGRFYAKQTMDEQLARYQEWFDRPYYRWFTESVISIVFRIVNYLATLQVKSAS